MPPPHSKALVGVAAFHIIIPARYGARRLPGKPLLDLGGKPMIQRVVECARRSAAASVTVATDEARIARAVTDFGGTAVMTAAHHLCGTDRIAEAAAHLGFEEHEIIVNLQGDEPLMPPALIDQVARHLAHRLHAAMATASAPLDPGQLTDPSVVKVVTDRDGYALYFSRAAIAWMRDAPHHDATAVARRHIGIYAYRCGYLQRFSARPACALEQHEQLEQLRGLWYGDRIACAEAVEIPAAGIDTPGDVARIRRTAWPDSD
ncbi:MAG: 3-deoxy-manno-octulosonate cytidylyltransferase [Gammaproteobacteria bacterium]|nr:3-deoxy-manno-octulosonate cytidylyltransferase [Gammaproteobacteria bacterium]